MRYQELICEEIKITNTCQGSYRGVLDMAIHAYDGNDLVAYIDYTANRDGSRVGIKMIKVGTAYRRQKLATAMLKRLQAEYPDTEIEWGMLTDQGSALKQTVPFRSVPNDEVRAKIDQLAAAKLRLKQFEDMFASVPTPIPSGQFAYWEEINNEWNQTHDEVRQLECDLYDTRPDRHLMDFQ